MPDLSMPEIHLPDIKLPEGLRDMNRHDIQNAISERMPKKIEMPDVDLSKIDLPKAIEDRLNKVEKAINKMDLPKAVEDRMPRRKKRANPILPIAALVAIGSMFVAAWWLITSPSASLKVRETADRIKARMTGRETGLQRFDDEAELGSLLPNPDQTRPSPEAETFPDTFAELGETVSAGNGSTSDRASV
ncbi:MAG TPA: hypothetical protein VHM48_02285 [Candidatus Limnocylindrales bacterium]|nr:hypothetical protein [Candidatus Limnocylindrales bacterium]